MYVQRTAEKYFARLSVVNGLHVASGSRRIRCFIDQSMRHDSRDGNHTNCSTNVVRDAHYMMVDPEGRTWAECRAMWRGQLVVKIDRPLVGV